MPFVLALAYWIVIGGWLTFILATAWSARLSWVVWAQWQLIGPETERELREQGMPDGEGLSDPWWQHTSWSLPYARVARALANKTLHTDAILAHAVGRYRRARHVARLGLVSALAAMVMSQP